jgi:nucleotide-binding universal stress UspA family protein
MGRKGKDNMKPIEHILFPVDLTGNPEHIIAYVIDAVQKSGSSLVVLYVVSMLKYFNSIHVPHFAIELIEIKPPAGGYENVQCAAGPFNSIDSIFRKVLLGDPNETILDFLELYEGELLQGAHKKMKEFAARHFRSIDNMFKEVFLGDPAETILDFIDTNPIDMVVMGSRDRSEPGRVRLGSVAEKVIKNSPVPVLIINPDKPARSTADPGQ